MTFRLHKNKRKSTWYYVRRVPLHDAKHDQRALSDKRQAFASLTIRTV